MVSVRELSVHERLEKRYIKKRTGIGVIIAKKKSIVTAYSLVLKYIVLACNCILIAKRKHSISAKKKRTSDTRKIQKEEKALYLHHSLQCSKYGI